MGFSPYNDVNRLQNLDGIEWKIVNELIKQDSAYADKLWKILKYDSDVYALSKPSVEEEERRKLVCTNNGEPTGKRLFLQPFVDDAWSEQCSSVYVYVDEIIPFDQARANVIVTVEAIVHAKTSVIAGDGDQDENPNANPNDSNEQGNIVVTMKNRGTVLVKSIIAALNGLSLDGIGYLQFNAQTEKKSGATLSLWNSRSHYGYKIKFVIAMGGVSENPGIGF